MNDKNILNFLLTLPEILTNLANNIFYVLNFEVDTMFGNVKVINILATGLIITIMLVQIAKWISPVD